MHTISQLKSGELQGIKRLTLAENLSEFPMEILSLADSLEILDLSNNRLSSLPSELKQLHRLKVIFASHNCFNSLPEVLGQCANLEMIGFKSNAIQYVSGKALPTKLRWLILTDNQIELLPQEIGERPLLQKLALAGNRLTSLPASMAQCKNLELVRISANRLNHCPDHLLDLPKLAWLAFSGNPFSQSDLPSATVPLVKSSSFTLLDVLGQGASGVIYQGEWQCNLHNLPPDIAVKVFKGEVTSDGYPRDEMHACLQVGQHNNLVQPLAQVSEDNFLALIMGLIPARYKNLGLPPSLESCTRDTFPTDFSLSPLQITTIIQQMQNVFMHLHNKQVCHGDLYAHNTLIDEECNIIFGDFGAASMYHMLSPVQQQKIQVIEARALQHFIDDLHSVCETNGAPH